MVDVDDGVDVCGGVLVVVSVGFVCVVDMGVVNVAVV